MLRNPLHPNVGAFFRWQRVRVRNDVGRFTGRDDIALFAIAEMGHLLEVQLSSGELPSKDLVSAIKQGRTSPAERTIFPKHAPPATGQNPRVPEQSHEALAQIALQSCCTTSLDQADFASANICFLRYGIPMTSR